MWILNTEISLIKKIQDAIVFEECYNLLLISLEDHVSRNSRQSASFFVKFEYDSLTNNDFK